MDLLIADGSVPAGQEDLAPATGTAQYATSGNPLTSPPIPPTRFPAYAFNGILKELVAVITGLGGTPDRTNNSQLVTLLKGWFAPLISPAFTKKPTAPTPPAGDKSTLLATTAFVTSAISAAATTMTNPGTAGTFDLIAPENALAVEVMVIGGGGRGSPCQGSATSGAGGTIGNVSGAGGGAGGFAWGVYPVVGGATYQAIVGAGGSVLESANSGGTSSFGPKGGDPFLSAAGGEGATIANAFSAGGEGGAAIGGNIVNNPGGCGSDGQAGNFVFAGNGAGGPFGGGGRAGNQNNDAEICRGRAYGAAGAGAYDASMSNQLFSGAEGAQGCVLYRWIF